MLVLGTVAGLNYDFSWTNGTTKHIYLPREALALLPYKLATLTYLDVKNIGYLYAIANGARVVLDLEDGIVPIPIGRTYLPMQNEKREYQCPNLEEKEGTEVFAWKYLYMYGTVSSKIALLGSFSSFQIFCELHIQNWTIPHKVYLIYN